ncbi:replication initiation protein [uncultured Clostridium sp.]|uniref:replication initiation protein n=1 Tax=uncultured Clostridium sp. TaxID=59620 RepID=UPI002634D407|nr:replication initiation protein [uncultured Clostridium sp.]
MVDGEEIQLSKLNIKISRNITDLEKRFFGLFIVGIDEENLDEEIMFYIKTLEECFSISSEEVVKLLTSINEITLYVLDDNEEEYIINPLSYIKYNLKENKVFLKYNNSIVGLFQELKRIYFNINNGEVKNLKGKYTWKLYEILKGLEENKTYYISIDYLKKVLRIGDNYKLYADFKRKVILYVQKEIDAKTDIKFSFEEKKEEKKIVGVYITTKKKNQIL